MAIPATTQLLLLSVPTRKGQTQKFHHLWHSWKQAQEVFFMTQRVMEIGCPENASVERTPMKTHKHSLQWTASLIKEINSGVILMYVDLQGPYLGV